MESAPDVSGIRELAARICPDIAFVISHNSAITASTWNSSVQTGKAVELLALCALVAEMRSAGHIVTFPTVYVNKPDLFYLRNIIPRHHGSQAGHAAANGESLPLLDRFIAALTPKAMARTARGRCFLIYREGHPVHFISSVISGGLEYLDRPDLLIAEGEIELKVKNATELEFIYEHPYGDARGSLRIRNDIKIPLVSFTATGSSVIPINGIIECSVGKGRDKAEEQLNRYLNICTSPIRPTSMLINGRKKSGSVYDYEVFIDLTMEDAGDLFRLMSVGLKKFVLDL